MNRNQPEEQGESVWFDPEFMLPVQHSSSSHANSLTTESGRLAGNKRLVVVLPNSFSNYQEFAQKVHLLSLTDRREILYVALFTDDNELEMQRWLITLEAITRDPMVRVQSKLIKYESWIENLRNEIQPSDLIICPNEYRIKKGYFKTVSLSLYLQDNVSTNIRGIPGGFRPLKHQFAPWLRIVLFWIGCLVILFGFGILEIDVDGMLHGIIRPVILIMLLVVEMGVIWIWNSVID